MLGLYGEYQGPLLGFEGEVWISCCEQQSTMCGGIIFNAGLRLLPSPLQAQKDPPTGDLGLSQT